MGSSWGGPKSNDRREDTDRVAGPRDNRGRDQSGVTTTQGMLVARGSPKTCGVSPSRASGGSVVPE